jgi:CO/xanthine dehydrogenase FAD-binding subunit
MSWAPRRHTMLIDINPVAPLRYVRNDAGLVEIGAITR